MAPLLANNLATIQQSSACLLSFVTATKGFVVLTIQILATRSRVARGRQQSTSISWPFTGVTAQDCSHCNFPVINFSAKTENTPAGKAKLVRRDTAAIESC